MNTFESHHGDAVDVLRSLPSSSVDAIIIDPPYGMQYQSARRIDTKKRFPVIANDSRPYIWWMSEAYRVLKDDTALYCFSDWKNSEAFRFGLTLAGFNVRSQAIWDRESHGMGDLKSALAPQHDVIWFATKGKFTFPGKRPKSVFRCPRISAAKLMHSNEKPLGLMKQLAESITAPDQTILDPFMGSASTGVAALQCKRNFIGVELDPHYFSIAEQRLQKQAEAA